MSDLAVIGYASLTFAFFVVAWVGWQLVMECWESWIEAYQREQAFKEWRNKKGYME